MGVIIFDGKLSKEYGFEVAHFPDYEIPAREEERVTVPGRDGEVILDSGNFKNVDRTYHMSFGSLDKTFESYIPKLSEWLYPSNGYCRLEDSYEPDYFRMASLSNSAVITNIEDHAGTFDLTFNCKPQKFLKSGELPISCTASITRMDNPTGFNAHPMLRVETTGAGSIRITNSVGTYPIQIKKSDTPIMIDCELGEAYWNHTNLSGLITLDKDSGFPVLAPGNNVIWIIEGVSELEVVPRWWIL